MRASFLYTGLLLALLFSLSAEGQSSLNFWKLDSLLFQMEASKPFIEARMEETDSASGDYYFLKALALNGTEPAGVFFTEAGKHYRKEGDTLAAHLAQAYYGGWLWKQSRYQQALAILQKELEYAVLHKYDYLQFYSLLMLFKTHYQLNNFLKANEYLGEAHLIIHPRNRAAAIKTRYFKVVIYQSLAMAKIPHNGHYPTNARCVELADEVIPLLRQYNYNCLLSKAWVLRTFSLYEGNLAGEDSCLNSLNRAMQIALRGGCQEPFEFALANKARYLGKLGRKLEESDQLFKMLQSQPGNISHMGWSHQIISTMYAGQGDWKSAYLSLLKSDKYHKELYSQQIADALAAQAVKFETFKKDLENERLAGLVAIEKARQQRLGLLFALFMTLSFGGAFLYWIHYRHKAKLRETQIITRHLLEGEQKERMRVARDLHDSVGQLLSALKLQLGTLSLNAGQQGRTSGLLDKTIEEVRSISHNLLPKALDYFGLAKAIEEMADQYNVLGGLRVEVNTVGGQKAVKLSRHQELMLFRIVQENVQNIIKHSGAKEIGINIFNRVDELSITISYPGQEMTVDKLAASNGIGWKNILARTKLLNGHISFYKQDGESIIEIKVKAP